MINRFVRIAFLTLALTTSSVAGAVGQGPPGSPAEITRAQAAFQAGHVDSAIVTLEDYFRRNPGATAGRLLLGNAYRQKNELDRALVAYQAVTAPRPARIQAQYAMAGIQARRGSAEEALRLLGEVKATGAFDMDLAASAPEFETLRRHPDFPRVRFSPEDFRRPFVEPVRVIHEWVGETKGDQFSWIARGVGDTDGDGVSDLVASAPSYGANGQPAGPGKIYLYSGRTGALRWTQTGQAGENLGTGLEGAGDVDRDGIGDVIAGAPGTSRAYVYSGVDGKLLLTLGSGVASDGFGRSAAGAGDQDGDGHPDLIVGAPASNGAAQGAGRAYLFSGKNGARLAVLEGEKAGAGFGSIVAGAKSGRRTPILVGSPGAGSASSGRVYVYPSATSAPTFVIESDETGVALGAMFTSLVGDVDGDRVPDVYASDFANSASGPSTGRVYLHSGATGRVIRRLTGEGPGDGFGIGSADVGDVDRDGYDDLLIGAWQHSSGAPSGGKVYLYSGRDGTVIRTITGRVPGETLGFDATGIGDADGDGVVDFLVTSSWSNISGFRSGRMYLISGR
jgi:hypothetical protein